MAVEQVHEQLTTAQQQLQEGADVLGTVSGDTGHITALAATGQEAYDTLVAIAGGISPYAETVHARIGHAHHLHTAATGILDETLSGSGNSHARRATWLAHSVVKVLDGTERVSAAAGLAKLDEGTKELTTLLGALSTALQKIHQGSALVDQSLAIVVEADAQIVGEIATYQQSSASPRG